MSTIPITKRDVVVTLEDGAGHMVELSMEEGNITWTEGTPEALYFMDRGNLADTRDGDESAMDLSMTLAFTETESASYATTVGWLTRPAGSWEATNLVSSLGAGREWRVNVAVTFLGENRGGIADTTYRFPHFRPKLAPSEGDFLTMAVSGTCLATRPTLA